MVDEELREQSKNVETEKLVSPTILPIRKQVLQMIAVCVRYVYHIIMRI
jgi:hypothetical protein